MNKKKKEDEEAAQLEAAEGAGEVKEASDPDAPKVAKPQNVDAELITVKSGLNGNKVALWEENPEHPKGEVYIAGPGEFKVARTSEVQSRIRKGILIEVGAE